MKTVPLREIHEIELSSVCNLACRYCPHPKLQRAKAHMEWDVFERTLEHLHYFVQTGTQGEVSLTGIGEAILHPRFAEVLWRVRQVIGLEHDLVLATNGVAVTAEIARQLAAFRVTVYVSLHRPEVAGPAYELLKRSGVRVGHNAAFVDSSLDWAGQVDWHVSAKTHACTYLKDGWAVVRQDGAINACCMDAHSLHPIATVWDPLGSLQTRVTPLCGSCHLMPPAELQEAA